MTHLTGIKAVSFDVDGTLWDFEAVQSNALREALVELRTHDAEAEAMLSVNTLIDTRDRVQEQLRGRVNDLNELRMESFRRALTDIGRPDEALAARLTAVYFERRDAGRVPFADVGPTLEELAPRYTLGIISNGNTPATELGMDGLMSFEVFSQDHGGIEKPDTRLFEIALERAGCSAGELLHVGDSLENDVVGAARAGVKSVWLNRNGAGSRPDITPVAEIASLRELLEIL